MTTDEYAHFYKALADYYHVDRDRAEKCLSDIVDIMSNSEPDWVKSIMLIRLPHTNAESH